MTDTALPALAADAAPEFVDAQSCKEWLESIPLANVSAAQHDILVQVEEFNRFPTTAANRIEVLEVIREAVNFVQIEQAKRFTNRAQPMAEAESAVFEDTIELWEQMRLGYMRCMQAASSGDAAMRAQAATICQRLLSYVGLRMFHHYRAYREVSARDWRRLHDAYANAVSLGVEEESVKDYLNRDVHDTSSRTAYVRAVLMGMCNPNELSQRQLTFVAYLLERWASRVEVLPAPPAEGDTPPLIADLAGDRVPERLDAAAIVRPAREPRYLDATKLARTMRNRVGLLRKGESPAKLALGEDCVQPSCEQMLVFLYKQWCQARMPRATERRRTANAAQVCNDLKAIHYYISGKVFRPPGEKKELSKKQRDEIATFGRISTRDEDDFSAAQGILLEQWRLHDESIQGLMMIRAADAPGKRHGHGALVGIRPVDSRNFMLGQVRWLMQAANGELHAGVRLLPGLPAATAVRQTGINVVDAEFIQALSLTGVDALNAPPSLVLPVGWYKPKRVIEVFVDSAVRVRLTETLDRGIDFERVAYDVL